MKATRHARDFARHNKCRRVAVSWADGRDVAVDVVVESHAHLIVLDANE